MSVLYRIEFMNKTMSDHLDEDGIKKLIKSKKLTGIERIQKIPNGEWQSLKEHEFFEVMEATFIRKLSDFMTPEALESQAEPIPKLSDPDKTEFFPAEFPVNTEDSTPHETEEIMEEENPDKTRIIKITPDLGDFEDDKTRVRPDTIKHLERIRKEEEAKRKEEALRAKDIKVEEKIDYNNDSTQVINLKDIKKELRSEADEAEKELEKIQQEKDKLKKKESAVTPQVEEVVDNSEEEKKKKRKKIFYAVIIIGLLYVVLFPDSKPEKKNQIVVVYPQIQFPIEYEKFNSEKSNEHMRKGIIHLNQRNYVNDIMASKELTKSVEWQLGNTQALSKLFLVNSMLLDESKKLFKDANTTFKINKIIPGSLYTDLDRVKGISYFYKNIGKRAAALNILEKFSKMSKSPSFEIYAIWLELLLEEGLITQAREKYDILASGVEKNQTIEYLSPVLFISLIHYNQIQSELETANKWANLGLKFFPEDVGLILEKIKLYMLSQDPKGMEKYLVEVGRLGAGNKPAFHARYLEYSGFYQILGGDPKKAVNLFKESLSIKESKELRSRLAAIKASDGDKLIEELINESKAIDYYNQAIELMKEDRWREALVNVTKAVDISASYIPAKILFSKLQMRSGFYEQAILDLQKEIKDHPTSEELYFSLLEIYIKLYKFNDARSLINIISSSEMKEDIRFPSLLGKMYERMGDKLTAANWYVNSLNKNPLNDEDYYDLAFLYMQGNRFNEARKFLDRAIELEPFNVKYRAAYAKYLYDSKGTDVAIGYLLDLMNDDKFASEKAYLTGEIGIYYYRSGKIENFKDITKALLEMDYPKKNLYEYVIKTSLIDGEYEDVIQNAKLLLEIEAGDIETRMLLGKTYFEKEQYELALKEFKEVKEMMKDYPRLKYYIAKAHLSIGNRDEAYKMAKEEVDSNPHLEDGYILIADISVLNEKWLEAERNYRKALQIKGDSFDAIMGLAYINYRKNKQDSALTLYKKAQQLNTSNPDVYRMLGEIYRLLGQGRKAIDNYRVYLKRVPNSKYKNEIENYIQVME